MKKPDRHQQLLDGVGTPTPLAVLEARNAAGDTQAEAAARIGLSSALRWSEYERGVRTPDASRYALYLLATGQHPTATAAPRHRGKVSTAPLPSTVEKPSP